MPARILIMEDDRPSRELFTYLFGASGYPVRVVENGRLGIAAFEEWNPDLIVCDLQMPEVNGYEALARIRAAGGRHIPIIAVTALSMPDDRTKTLAAGFDGYFSKPITPETFVADIEQFLAPGLRAEGPRPAA